MRSVRIWLGLCAVAVLWIGLSQGFAQAKKTLPPAPPGLTALETLGALLYFDPNLSTPKGQSCASCHHPSAGFADPNTAFPVSQGAVPMRFGNRNSPTAAYAAYSPPFHWDEDEEMYFGGQFWDGRVATLKDQAKGPFLNSLEMKNPNKVNVVNAVRQSAYASLFIELHGPNAFKNVEQAYDWIADAIAAFERSAYVNPFSSKYDRYLAGEVNLTDQELRGLDLFNGKAMCAACHPSVVIGDEPGPLFTDFSYDNLGLPKNWDNPFLYLPKSLNPDGEDYVDIGLAGNPQVIADGWADDERGKFKVPTLRNIAMTAPYGHNGVFTSLHGIVGFYNSRDLLPGFVPEIADNMNVEELGDLGLSSEDIDDIVAFLLTLTDGYTE